MKYQVYFLHKSFQNLADINAFENIHLVQVCITMTI